MGNLKTSIFSMMALSGVDFTHGSKMSLRDPWVAIDQLVASHGRERKLARANCVKFADVNVTPALKFRVIYAIIASGYSQSIYT